jgi:hypothetical protein
MNRSLCVVFLIASLAASVSAQDSATPLPAATLPKDSIVESRFRGFNEYETFRGLVTSTGSLLKLDSSLGYDFNRNFGIFVGVPLYFSGSFASNTVGSTHAEGMGDAYLGAELYTFSRIVRYSTSFTVGLPTGSVAKGFSPDKVTADWTNHLRRSFGPLTPTFSIGVGNAVGIGVGALPTSEVVDRSLTSTGTFVHMEEGAELDVTRRTYIGGAGYHILPFGKQGVADNGNSGETTASTNSILRENGIDAWLGFEPTRVLRTEFGYSRSTTFALNSFSFKMVLNVGRMLRGREVGSN